MRPRPAALAALVGLALPSAAAACLWDYDTIRMERSRFPDALERITGKFLRHSPEFYHWRIADRLARLEADPTDLALPDDLGVAYDKTGRHARAVETAARADRLRPGRYETAANLGTFHVHAGRFDAGLPHVDRTLAIHPDAHFGREKYQRLLARYVLRRTGGRPTRPVAGVTVLAGTSADDPSAPSVSVSDTFADSLRPAGRHGPLDPAESAAAVKGVLGMMRFGTHDSPVLLEALGSLLEQGGSGERPTTDAKRLAARAYLKASYAVPDGPPRAVQLQTPRRDQNGQIALGQVEADFRKELAEADEWYAALRAKELAWVRDGRNPEAEFDKLYDAEPAVSGLDVADPTAAPDRLRVVALVLGVVALLVVVAAAVVLRRLIRRSFVIDGPGNVPR